jgi:hypothetical protein
LRLHQVEERPGRFRRGRPKYVKLQVSQGDRREFGGQLSDR